MAGNLYAKFISARPAIMCCITAVPFVFETAWPYMFDFILAFLGSCIVSTYPLSMLSVKR